MMSAGATTDTSRLLRAIALPSVILATGLAGLSGTALADRSVHDMPPPDAATSIASPSTGPVIDASIGIVPPHAGQLGTQGSRDGAQVAATSNPPAQIVMHSDTAETLKDRLDRLDYSLEATLTDLAPVPRVRVLAIPKDIGDIDQVEDRKALFFRILLPLVLKENERIRNDRAQIRGLAAISGGDPDLLNAEQRQTLERMMERYRLDEPEFEALLLRADIIPPSLALAQAAIESGWGTSRFAREGNALFGQITVSDDALAPLNQREGDNRRYASFGEIREATVSYMRNLNTHNAYSEMRTSRADLRENGKKITGDALVDDLHRYSERGRDYIAFVRRVIAINGLERADATRLAPDSQMALNRP